MNGFKGILFAVTSSATFGLIPFFALPIMKSGVGTPTILLYRFALSALIMGIVVLLRRGSFRVTRRQLGTMAVLGLLYSGTALGLFYAYDYMPSGVATTVHFLYPVVVSFLMVAFFGEKKSKTLVFATFMSILGVGLLSWSSGENRIELLGILFVMSTVFTYSLYIVGVNKSSVSRIDPLPLTFYVLTTGTILFLINALATGGIDPIPNSKMMINLFLLALVPTVVSGLTLVYAIKYVGSTVTSILGSMEPLTAVIIGVFYFSEVFTIRTFFGLTLIIVAVSMVVLSNDPQFPKRFVPEIILKKVCKNRQK